MSRPPCGWCQCQCKPKILAQWIGPGNWNTADGVDVAEVYRHVRRNRYKKAHQWRIVFDDTNAEWIRDWYLEEGNLGAPDTANKSFGGSLRDGTLYGGGTLEELPYRLELGCVSCRSCPCSASSQPSYGSLIYWPIREVVTTTPVFSEGELVDVNQTFATNSSDFGRSMTANEISRHHYWGNKFYGKPAESRKCPPEMIVWTHSHGGNTAQRVSTADVNGILDTDSSVHICDGWTGLHGVTTEYSQRFRDVNIDDVDIIRLTQPMYLSGDAPYDTYVAHEADDLGDEDYDAITDWLDRPGKLLIIDGSAAYQDNMPAFAAKFSSLTVTRSTAADTAYTYYHHDTGSAENFEIRSHDHSLTDYPDTITVPPFPVEFIGQSTHWLFWQVTGGETLYSFHWDDHISDPVNPVNVSIPGAAVETLESGSRVIVAPTSIIHHQRAATPNLVTNWTLYGNAGTIPNIRSHL